MAAVAAPSKLLPILLLLIIARKLFVTLRRMHLIGCILSLYASRYALAFPRFQHSAFIDGAGDRAVPRDPHHPGTPRKLRRLDTAKPGGASSGLPM